MTVPRPVCFATVESVHLSPHAAELWQARELNRTGRLMRAVGWADMCKPDARKHEISK